MRAYDTKQGIKVYADRPGPKVKPARDGDSAQAQRRVNFAVAAGELPRPSSLPCADCGSRWGDGDRRFEYHHHQGYAADHHFTVVALCPPCHRRRHGAGSATHCKRGHELDAINLYRSEAGHRVCRACDNERNRGRSRAEYSRAYRLRRKQNELTRE